MARWLDGWAPVIVMSGSGLVHSTSSIRPSKYKNMPEAQVFANIATDMGVPAHKILIEDQSQNSGQNVQFTKQLVSDKELAVRSAVVVHKPYMKRRAFATLKAQWPQLEVVMSSHKDTPQTYNNYTLWVHKMLGDLDRIIKYPSKGFMISQEVPKIVMQAYSVLKPYYGQKLLQ